MSIETWLYYVVAILILTASPGPSVLLCMTKAINHGFSAALLTALGSLTAIVGILTLSFTGLGVVIASSELAFNVIKWLGAAYLIYLGYQAFICKETSYTLAAHENDKSLLSDYLSGFMVGASNPKAIVFFTALFPQFIDPAVSMLSQYLIFAATFLVLELSWLLIYSYLGYSSSTWLLAKGRARVFNQLTGSVFIAAGVLLSSTSRHQQ